MKKVHKKVVFGRDGYRIPGALVERMSKRELQALSTKVTKVK